MRKIESLALAVLLAVMSVSCARQTAPRAGSATGESMLGLLPADSNGVFLVDVHRAMAIPAAVKALEDEEMRQKYETFVQEAGIDPMKDVYFLAAGIKIRPAQQEVEPTMVVNLRYEREALLGKIRERANGLEESDYEGLTIYALPLPVEGQGQKPFLAFLDASNIAVGGEAGVRAVIDVFHKKADSVRKSPEMAGILKSAETDALAWGAFALSPELVKSMIEDNAMLAPLEGVTGLHMAFDAKNKSTIMDFRTTGGTPDNNKNLADTLNGLKAMGALMAGQEPALGDLLGRIEITSGADFVRIHADIPQEIMDKLQEAAKSKLGAIVPNDK